MNNLSCYNPFLQLWLILLIRSRYKHSSALRNCMHYVKRFSMKRIHWTYAYVLDVFLCWIHLTG